MADQTPSSDASAVSAVELAQLKKLVEKTSALRDDERQYWLQLLPSMNTEQVNQLKGILETEQQNMQAIDQKYDQQLSQVGDKYLKRWDGEKARSQRIERREEEKSHLEEAEKKAEELLENW